MTPADKSIDAMARLELYRALDKGLSAGAMADRQGITDEQAQAIQDRILTMVKEAFPAPTIDDLLAAYEDLKHDY